MIKLVQYNVYIISKLRKWYGTKENNEIVKQVTVQGMNDDCEMFKIPVATFMNLPEILL